MAKAESGAVLSSMPHPRSSNSRTRTPPPGDDDLEGETEVLEPGDPGYEEAGDEDRTLIPAAPGRVPSVNS